MSVNPQMPKTTKYQENHSTKQCSSLDSISNNLYDCEIRAKHKNPK